MIVRCPPKGRKEKHDDQRGKARNARHKRDAATLKIEPRYLRVVLRSMGKGTGGERYEFTEKDLPKLTQMVKDYEEKKKAAKPAADKK